MLQLLQLSANHIQYGISISFQNIDQKEMLQQLVKSRKTSSNLEDYTIQPVSVSGKKNIVSLFLFIYFDVLIP